MVLSKCVVVITKYLKSVFYLAHLFSELLVTYLIKFLQVSQEPLASKVVQALLEPPVELVNGVPQEQLVKLDSVDLLL